MKKRYMVIIGVMLSFIIAFSIVGYAQLSDPLQIDGEAGITAQQNVFLVEATEQNGTLVSETHTGTLLTSSIDLAGDNKVVLRLQFYNNSDYSFTFKEVTRSEGVYSNTNVKYELDGLKAGDEIGPHEYIDCIITFTYSNSSTITNTTLNSVLNFIFNPSSDEDASGIAAVNVLEQFKIILNTPNDYNSLVNRIEDPSITTRGDDYIGNVVGSNQTDTTLLETLFTSDETGENMLKLQIGSETREVTCMIKKKDVDDITNNGNGDGDEMVLYLTADDIGEKGGWLIAGKVVVFAVVFRKDANGTEWYQYGQLYQGEATANMYTGNSGMFQTKDSFNTESWASTVSIHGLSKGKNINAVIDAYEAIDKNVRFSNATYDTSKGTVTITGYDRTDDSDLATIVLNSDAITGLGDEITITLTVTNTSTTNVSLGHMTITSNCEEYYSLRTSWTKDMVVNANSTATITVTVRLFDHAPSGLAPTFTFGLGAVVIN